MTKRVRLSAKQVAERVGSKPSTWRANVSRGLRPQPDGHTDPCGCPWWYESTIAPWTHNHAPSGQTAAATTLEIGVKERDR